MNDAGAVAERIGRGRALSIGVAALLARDRLVLGALLIVAALFRLPGLATRGQFDGDQAHDMLVLLRLTRDGIVPLLGPPTSIGDFHHGAAYYYLLAPAAAIGGSDPTFVVTEIALLGVAAVAATWWVARMMGGGLAALCAGLLLAVSPAAVSESTFIWNPNPIPLFAALALGCAWRAWSGGRPGWWAVAIASAGMVVQLHVLGIVFLLAILGLGLAAVIRAGRAGEAAASPGVGRALVGRALVAGIAIVAVLYVPLLVHEVGSGFDETRHLLEYVGTRTDRGSSLGPAAAVLFTLLRAVGWPLVGVVTDAFVPALVATVAIVVLVAAELLRRGEERSPLRSALSWLAATLVVSVVALTFAAPSLLTVVPGLPNDHYHAFLDPVVAVIVGLLVARLVTRRGRPRMEAVPDTTAGIADAAPTDPPRLSPVAPFVVAAYVALIALALVRQPAGTDPEGGWPAARVAGERIAASAGGRTLVAAGVPSFKTPDLGLFPAAFAGAAVDPDLLAWATPLSGAASRPPDPAASTPWDRYVLVVPCDRLFEGYTRQTCGGEAEDARAAELAASLGRAAPALVERLDLSGREAVSLYRP